jgi:hypothetical protein
MPGRGDSHSAVGNARGAMPAQRRSGRTTGRSVVESGPHEAAQWADALLPFDDQPTNPKASFKPLERAPRTRYARLAVVSLAVALTVGLVVLAKTAQPSIRASIGIGPDPLDKTRANGHPVPPAEMPLAAPELVPLEFKAAPPAAHLIKRHRKTSPRHGIVWSPAADALVPADPAPSAADPDEDADPFDPVPPSNAQPE